MKTILCFLLLWVCMYAALAQNGFRPSDYRCLSASVHYVEDGQKQTGLLFLISHKDTSNQSFILSSLYLLNKENGNRLLYDGLTGVYDLRTSEKSSYTAILTVGEGHPWIEIINTQFLIDHHEYRPIAEIQPYPGNVSIVKWIDDDHLLLESDIDLSVKNEGKALEEKNLLSKNRKFVFDVKTKRFKIYR